MSIPRHLEEAAGRLKDATYRIEGVRAKAPTLESLAEWAAALTDYCASLADIQSYNNESIHEKLAEIRERLERVT